MSLLARTSQSVAIGRTNSAAAAHKPSESLPGGSRETEQEAGEANGEFGFNYSLVEVSDRPTTPGSNSSQDPLARRPKASCRSVLERCRWPLPGAIINKRLEQQQQQQQRQQEHQLRQSAHLPFELNHRQTRRNQRTTRLINTNHEAQQEQVVLKNEGTANGFSGCDRKQAARSKFRHSCRSIDSLEDSNNCCRCSCKSSESFTSISAEQLVFARIIISNDEYFTEKVHNLPSSTTTKQLTRNIQPRLGQEVLVKIQTKRANYSHYLWPVICWLILASSLFSDYNNNSRSPSNKFVSCKSIENKPDNNLLNDLHQSPATEPPGNQLSAQFASSSLPSSPPPSSSPPHFSLPSVSKISTTARPTTVADFETSSKVSTLSDFFRTITSVFTGVVDQTISTTPLPTSWPDNDTDSDEDDSSFSDDDDDAEGCQGIPIDGSAKAKNLTDTERLVNLQTCLQRKIKKRLLGATRTGMELFEKLSLSGGCTSSLLTMASSLGEIKSFAFKFIDATAKVPSGVMYGLLSDYGDFDQCLSIRSNPLVRPEDEIEENTFSGKYCLLSVKLNYHIELPTNATVPEGIIPDGIFWDELVRNYWTSKSSKGFQIGVCVPSRCTNDDLEQIYKLVTESYNVQGEVMTCQDSNDLRRQLTPDAVQKVIIYVFISLSWLSVIGSLVERYMSKYFDNIDEGSNCDHDDTKPVNTGCRCQKFELAYRMLVCFSICRNWKYFISSQNAGQDLLTNSSENIWRVNVNNGQRISNNQQQRTTDLSSKCQTTEITDQSLGSVSISHASSNQSVANGTVIANDHITNRCIDMFPDTTTITAPVAVQLANNPTDHHEQQTSCEDSYNNCNKFSKPLTVDVRQDNLSSLSSGSPNSNIGGLGSISINHLSGLKLIVIIWITIGHSFLYPSANNYQYYRSIININITRDSVWFATTNFTLGIDMLLYMAGLVFVYKLARFNNNNNRGAAHSNDCKGIKPTHGSSFDLSDGFGIMRSIFRKVLRFWPTYLAVIAIAIVVPLVADGPMWPEMVSKRLGSSCRRNFWANLLVINNFFSQNEICLPSSWFVSVLMQLILIGSIIIMLARRVSLNFAISVLTLLLIGSSAMSFAFAYYMNLRAPVIRMDESFVMELDENIFSLYTNIFNNLGPFLIGLAGGLILLKTTEYDSRNHYNTGLSSLAASRSQSPRCCSSTSKTKANSAHKYILYIIKELVIGLVVVMIAIGVLSSVFHQNYSRIESSIYWATHRIGWAIVTGYIIHQCATGKWTLMYEMLSLSTFIPLSKLVFISYLVYPIFIHLHSGFVRDGLHVSIYNMMNIYITRLVLTFGTALTIHLLVELPFCSLEELLITKWLNDSNMLKGVKAPKDQSNKSFHPLLAVAPMAQFTSSNHITETSLDKTESKLIGDSNS